MTDADKTRGLYKKYDITRLNDEEGKHDACEYFVLDLTHDKFAVPALRAYAEACRGEYPKLAEDLLYQASSYEAATVRCGSNGGIT